MSYTTVPAQRGTARNQNGGVGGHFRNGTLPIEGFVNGTFPAVSESTLKRLAPQLRKRNRLN